MVISDNFWRCPKGHGIFKSYKLKKGKCPYCGSEVEDYQDYIDNLPRLH
jgi:uncharacterized C2H2 Zn-finger protein